VSDTTWGAPRRLTREESWGGRWSPDGRTIAHCRPDGLWLVAPDGSGARRLLATAGDSSSPSPELTLWAPDGRTLYYKAFDEAGWSSFWAVSLGGGAPRLLVRFDDPRRPSSRAEFATDGRRLFFTIGTRQSDVWAMALRPP
jgi:Tol biopolymer transport system component